MVGLANIQAPNHLKRDSIPGEQIDRTSGDGGGSDGDGGVVVASVASVTVAAPLPVWWCVSRLVAAASATPIRYNVLATVFLGVTKDQTRLLDRIRPWDQALAVITDHHIR